MHLSIFSQDCHGLEEGGSKIRGGLVWWFSSYLVSWMRVMQTLGGEKSIVVSLREGRVLQTAVIARDACGECMVMQTSAPKGKHPVMPLA